VSQVTEVVKLRRRVLVEISKLAFAGEIENKINEILYNVVSEDGPRYRCCVHKERAVLKERIKLALSQGGGLELSEAAKRALAGNIEEMPIVHVLREACDQCPIDKFIVTNACRNCVAHNCINSCPKKAIMVVQNRAYIDKNKCVECGLCKKSCQYSAIIEVNRPCEGACDLGAIQADNDRRAEIDYTKCVQCGSCKTACPFGAITDRSSIVQLVSSLKSNKKVYAMLAPSFIGQFGAKAKPGQVIQALKQIGFAGVYEASCGADIVTLEETKEFASSVPSTLSFMTTSCCPAFADMVEKHLPDIQKNVSTTVSPMIATGKVIKNQEPDAVVVFIGPCIAKKAEAEKYAEVIDYVLTFEELMCMLVGAGINIAEIGEHDFDSSASRDGNAFARAGGVAQAVLNTAAVLAPDVKIKAHHSQGLGNCKTALMQINTGKIDANFFEGMACQGGCVGGPGTLTNYKVTGKLVENFALASKAGIANDNRDATAEIEKQHYWHRK
jgi:[FeFe] hydrogenase (group B1/B3)